MRTKMLSLSFSVFKVSTYLFFLPVTTAAKEPKEYDGLEGVHLAERSILIKLK
jgi:hypothetical protein